MNTAYKTADSSPRVNSTAMYAGEAPEIVARGLRLIRSSTASESGASTGGAELRWLEEIYSLRQAERTDDAIDLLFKTMNATLVRGDFAACESALRALDLKRIDVDLMIAFLSITLPARDRLKSRAGLFAKIERLLTDLDPRRGAPLLSGLR